MTLRNPHDYLGNALRAAIGEKRAAAVLNPGLRKIGSAKRGTPEGRELMEKFQQFHRRHFSCSWSLARSTTAVHVYAGPSGSLLIIEERPQGFAWDFGHPCDAIAPSLPQAEKLLAQDFG